MSVERKVVLLTGPAGAGKSTALKTITDCRECLTFSFASPIKQMIKTLCPDADVHGKDKNTPLDALNGFSPRHAMQTLGTEWGRNCMGGDIWVKAAIEKVKAHDGTHLSVFDDARFPNEVSFMQDAFQF